MTITILLVGNTGAGKSALGNVLLGYNSRDGPFEVGDEGSSCTSDFVIRSGYFCGNSSRPIRVIDSPGFSDSEGRDNQFGNKLNRMMNDAGLLHVLLWCRNGTIPRIDNSEFNQLAACYELFGGYLLENLMVNMTCLPQNSKVKSARERCGKSFEKIKTNFVGSLKCLARNNQSPFPIFDLDSCYDANDREEVQVFRNTREQMWKMLEHLGQKEVFTKQQLRENTDNITREARKRAEADSSWWVKILISILSVFGVGAASIINPLLGAAAATSSAALLFSGQ